MIGLSAFVLLLVGVLAASYSPRSHAQSPVPASTTRAYKIERFGWKAKDMDAVLTVDGKDGWRVSLVESVGPYHNDLVFVMEKPTP
jgi:hypothetical protein